MAIGGYGSVLRQIQRLFDRGTVAALDEGQLLERFVAGRDEAAFEALVARHGPMVLGVCRRLLADPNDADDAFQATFLVLVKKAHSIRDAALLGNWLYGVAYRVAARARAQSARRRAREAPGAEEAAVEASRDGERGELRSVIDEEVNRLPEKYRAPIVLCYLQGQTHEAAAERLRWPVGTVRSRMARARELLRARLVRRGLALPAGVLGATLAAESASAAVSPALREATVRAALQVAAGKAIAAGVVSAGAASLTEGVLKAMFASKIKGLAAVVLALGAVAGGAGVVARQVGGDGAAADDDRPSRGRAGDAEAARLRARLDAVQKQASQLGAEVEALRKEVAQLRPAPGAGVGRGSGRGGGGSGGMAGMAPGGVGGMPGMMGGSPSGNIVGGGAGMMPGGAGMPGMGGPMGGGMAAGRVGRAGMMGMGGRMMDMSGGMAAGGGMMPGAAKSEIPTIANQAMIVLPMNSDGRASANNPHEGDRIAAYSIETGAWKTYRAPEGTKAVPLMTNGVVGLDLKGPKITQTAAFDPKSGRWYPQDLREPAEGHVPLIATEDLLASVVGRRVYAFSGPAQRWDVLELEEGAEPTPILGTTYITVEHDKRLYVFSAKTGRWSGGFDAKGKEDATDGSSREDRGARR
jgi:RNA polymerase sigma factor (sigma-70 family)